ncbi:hypothetical protein ANCCAN_23970 [Ancylostoma caninum]|uniref:Uncharacterized protein n=1 Tax=Ancylostoma caninum TaxID=29170 RepID=A0A368FDL5_ANCCA|nr:hypothetical protein ANCCAN_23970 [Ancylostoma caninum]
MIFFGVSAEMLGFMNDLGYIAAVDSALLPIHMGLRKLLTDMFSRYEHTKYFFCANYDQSLATGRSVCSNANCRIEGITPKRTKQLKRTSVHLVSIFPQLRLILNRKSVILVYGHASIHANGVGVSLHFLIPDCFKSTTTVSGKNYATLTAISRTCLRSPFRKTPNSQPIISRTIGLFRQWRHLRQSGGWAKNENLKNIPEEIVSVIIDCLMEGFGMGQPELLMDADVLKEAPTRYQYSISSLIFYLLKRMNICHLWFQFLDRIGSHRRGAQAGPE